MNNKISYRHGGTPVFDQRRLNLPERPVRDFSVNINPLGSPLVVKENWAGLVSAVERYPSMHGDGVASYYEDKSSIYPRNVLAGNGSTEMIYLVPRVLHFRHALIHNTFLP